MLKPVTTMLYFTNQPISSSELSIELYEEKHIYEVLEPSYCPFSRTEVFFLFVHIISQTLNV